MPDLLKVRTSLADAVQLLESEVISQLPEVSASWLGKILEGSGTR